MWISHSLGLYLIFNTLQTFLKNYGKIFLMKYLILFLTFSIPQAMANNFLDEFDKLQHENTGCPINTSCSKKMGTALSKWEAFIKKTHSKNQFNKLQVFFKNNGIPLYFLSTKEAKISLDPIIWDSRCRFHIPKNPNNRIVKAMKFLKKLPKNSLYNFTPLIVYNGKDEMNYRIPYEDYPFAIKDERLFFIKDYDDFYYYYSVDKEGNLQIENLNQKLVNMAMDKKQDNIKCPTSMKFDDKYFSQSFCQKIQDLKTKELKIIQYAWSCP